MIDSKTFVAFGTANYVTGGILKSKIFLLCLSLCVVLSSGCATLLVTGASGGVAYTVTNIAYKTESFPIDKVESATRRALKNMGMVFTGKEKIEDGIRITAVTEGLDIYIDLERITSKSTKISVDARKNLVLKDKATATEIIAQIEKFLNGKNK